MIKYSLATRDRFSWQENMFNIKWIMVDYQKVFHHKTLWWSTLEIGDRLWSVLTLVVGVYSGILLFDILLEYLFGYLGYFWRHIGWSLTFVVREQKFWIYYRCDNISNVCSFLGIPQNIPIWISLYQNDTNFWHLTIDTQ